MKLYLISLQQVTYFYLKKCLKCFPVIKACFTAACPCLEWRVKPRGLQSSKFNELGLHMAADQVLSLTQFFSVGFSQSRVSVKSTYFYRHTIKVCIRCFWRYLWTSAPSATHFPVSFYLWDYGSNTQARLRSLKAAMSAQKAFQGSETFEEISCWKEQVRIGCKVHRILSYISLGTYVKIRIRTCRIFASQVRRYVRRIKLKSSLLTNFLEVPKQ